MEQASNPRTGLTKHETRSNLARFTWFESLRGVYLTICGGTTFVFVAFARSLGVSKEGLGWIQALISVACFVPLAVLPLTNVVRRKKRFILAMSTLDPLLMIGAVLLAPLAGGSLGVAAFAAAVFLSAVSLRVTQPFTDEWAASVIPAGLRGRYLGRKFQVWSAALIASTLLVGWAMQRTGKTSAAGLAWILAAGGLMGFLAVATLGGASMPSISAASRVRWGDFLGVLKTRPFRRTVGAIALYNLPFYFACPYYNVYHLDTLNMAPIWIAVGLVGYHIVRVLSGPALGRLADRLGPGRLMFYLGPVYVVFFLAYPAATPQRFWLVTIAWTMVGLADAGVTVALLSSLYAVVPDSRARPAYFLLYTMVNLGTFALGGALAAPVLTAIRDVHLPVGPLVFGNFQLLYAACVVMMAGSTFAARLLPRK